LAVSVAPLPLDSASTSTVVPNAPDRYLGECSLPPGLQVSSGFDKKSQEFNSDTVELSPPHNGPLDDDENDCQNGILHDDALDGDKEEDPLSSRHDDTSKKFDCHPNSIGLETSPHNGPLT
jgi:hypothetical protein